MSDLVQKLECYNGTALIETIKESAGKFELPDTSNTKPQKGRIILISKTNDITDAGIIFKCPAKIGDVVYYKNWSSDVVNLNGRDYVLVPFRHIVMGVKE